ncbi:ATP-dependent zinc metalloprotease FtsH [Sinomicrobium kalidii]|uniref:ATP-dependent zinc metalloprotease FtsH n=1 Tax=Sinomicrobium kalidii TaxID=2900738 RepID=UPI001E51B91A|nr:ATP-dependent zinc metalloprotease FtsH [Sinomicrobium kalidii]UGU14715.1 ATP-dependent zinc metalloprotease FtsH [Sinomicrobium kalidii]
MSWIYMILFMVLIWLWFFKGQNTIQETTWKQFEEEMLIPKDVARLTVVNNARVEIYIREESLDKPLYKNIPRGVLNDEPVPGPHFYFNIGSVEIFHAELEKAQENLPGTDHVTVTYSTRENWWQNFLFLLPIGFLILFWMFLLRRSMPGMKGKGTSIFNFGQSNARVIEKGAKSKITFKDVAGMEEAKEEIYELITFLKSPDKYKRLGAKMPKGVLLVGPPGTGKTLLAKAIAGEAGVPFFSLSGSEFVEMFVGVGASRMRDLFQKAKAKAPCIIFIDEIDTVGRARGKTHAFQANDERESTLNQLLAELDGFDTDAGVIVLAATNRGDVLDPALLRPGRFDRHIHLELPNLKEREAIFSVHIKPLQLSGDVNTAALAAQTPGFSGADIANICNEAALIAARREKQVVGKQDFMDAIDRVIGGLEKKSKIITPEEKRRIAYHEAGHVTASWYLEHAHPVLKVSIIPRGRSLGAAWYIPEERQIITRSEFFDAICTALGGRAAEELIFEEVSSNALDDLEKATKQAYNMVVNYGLGTTLRNISFYDSTGRTEQSLYRSYSERTAQKIDSEAQQIIDDAYDKTIQILLDHQDQLHALAKALIRKETLLRPDVEKILGARKKSEDHASP